MSFSLQPKRFANSEHIGKTTEIALPFGKNQAEISVKIHYVDEGSGQPLILVHSAGQSLYTWNKVIPELSVRFRVIAIDLTGHGYSNAPQYFEGSVSEQAVMLDALMKKLSIASAHFVGFSIGCAVIAKFAVEHPTKCGRIVMLSPGGITQLMPTLVRMFDSAFLGAIASMFLTKNAIAGLLQECFLDLTRIDETMIEQYSKPLENADIKRGARLLSSSFDDDEFMHSLAAVESPVHVMLASDDKWRTPDLVQPYFDLLKIGTSDVVRNAGHLMHEEQPQKIVAAICSFIEPESSTEE